MLTPPGSAELASRSGTLSTAKTFLLIFSACDLEALQAFLCNPEDLFLHSLSRLSHGQSHQNVNFNFLTSVL